MNNSKKGYSLVVAIVLSAVMTIFIASLVVIASFSLNVTISDNQRDESYINAKSALKIAESYYMQIPNLPTSVEYFCIDSNSGSIQNATDPVDIITDLGVAQTYSTYVEAKSDPTNGTFTLTANADYLNKGLTADNTTTVVCSYNVGYDPNSKLSTAIRKVDTSDPYRYVTIHVKPYPGGAPSGNELNPPYLYTWASGDGQADVRPVDGSDAQPAKEPEVTQLTYQWINSTDAQLNGPQCAMEDEGNGWYKYTITLTDDEIHYFNAIITQKGALRDAGDHNQTSEMFNLPTPENAGETQDVYITLNDKTNNFTDKLGLDLNGNTKSNSMTQYYTSYVEAEYTTVHMRVTEDTGNTAASSGGKKLDGYTVKTNTIQDENLITSMERAYNAQEGIVPNNPYTGGSLQYEGFGWYTVKIPTSSSFDLTLVNGSGQNVFTEKNILGSTQNEVWIALDKNFTPTVEKTEEAANEVFTKWGDTTAGQYQTVNVKGLALDGGTPPDVQIKYNVDNDTSEKEAEVGEYSIILNYQDKQFKTEEENPQDTTLTYTRDNGDIFEFPNMSPQEGYTFLGWSMDKNATDGTYKPWSDEESEKYYVVNPADEKPVDSKEIRFYAIWEEADYSVTYDSNGGGVAPESQKVTTKKPAIIPDKGKMTKAGYNFVGWTDEKEGTKAKEEYAPGKEITIDTFEDGKTKITLYAVWEKMDDVYVVHYNLNGGSGTPPTDLTIPKNGTVEERTVTIPVSKVYRTGYDFGGWAYTNQEGEKVVILPDTENNKIVVEEDTELVAQWIETRYTVEFDANGGEDAPESITNIKPNTEITIPKDEPKKDEMMFIGWSTNKNATTAQYVGNDKIKVNENIKLYAVWKEINTSIYLSSTLQVAPLVYAWTNDSAKTPIFGGYDNNNKDEKRMTLVAKEGNNNIWKIDITEEYKNTNIGVLFFKNDSVSDNNKLTTDRFLNYGEYKIFYANGNNNGIYKEEVLTKEDIEEKYDNGTWKEVSSTNLNSESFIELQFDDYIVEEAEEKNTNIVYSLASGVKNIFTEIFKIFEVKEDDRVEEAVTEIETVNENKYAEMSIKTSEQSSQEEETVTEEVEIARNEFTGNTYLYIDTAKCDFTKDHGCQVAAKFYNDSIGLVKDYITGTEIEKDIWRIPIPQGDYNEFSVGRKNSEGLHNEVNNISLSNYDSNGINCYVVAEKFNEGDNVGKTLTKAYKDTTVDPTDPDDDTPISGTYGSMANRQGEKVQYYNVYMDYAKQTNNNIVSVNYNSYGWQTRRAGNSETVYYNEWYTYKIPTDDTSEYDVQFKNLTGNNNAETIQINDLTGDVYVTLDTNKTNSSGKYNDLSIYTFDPEENYAASSTRIYFENTEGWADVYACYWGVNSKNWGSSKKMSVDSATGKLYIDVPSSSPYIIFHDGNKDEDKAQKTAKVSLTGKKDEVLYNYATGWETYIHPEDAFLSAYDRAVGALNVAIFSDKADDDGSNPQTFKSMQKLIDDNKGTYDNAKSNRYTSGTTAATFEDAAVELENYTSALLAYADIIREARIYLPSSSYTEDDDYNSSTIKYTQESLDNLKKEHDNAMALYDKSGVTETQINSAVVKVRRAIDYGLQPELSGGSTSSGSLTTTANQAIIVLQDDENWAMTDTIMNEVTGIIYEQSASGSIKNVKEEKKAMEYTNTQGYYLYYIEFTGGRNKADFGFTPPGMKDTYKADTLTGIEPGEIWIYNNSTNEWKLNNDEGLQIISSSTITGKVGESKWYKPLAGETQLTLYFNNDTTVKYGSAEYIIFAGAYEIPRKDFPNGINLYSEHAKSFFTDPINFGMTSGGGTNIVDAIFGATIDTTPKTLTTEDNDVKPPTEAELNNVGYDNTFTSAAAKLPSSTSTSPYIYTGDSINFRWVQGDNGDPMFINESYLILDSDNINFASTDVVVNLDSKGMPRGSIKVGESSIGTTYNNKIIFNTDVNILVYNHDGSLNRDKSFVIYNGKYELQGQVDLLDFKEEMEKTNGKVKNVDKSVLSGGVYS